MNDADGRKPRLKQAPPIQVAQQAAAEPGTVKRVLLLLRCLVDHPGETAQSLARRVNLPRSTVHRLLTTLCADQYAMQDPSGTFEPGLEMYRLAGKLAPGMPYVKLAESHLQALSKQFRETSILTLLERQQLKMFHAACGSPSDPMRYNIRLNALEPLLWGATARVVLAHLTDKEISEVVARREPSPVSGVVAKEQELRKSLRQIREEGAAITNSHRTPGTIGVAAPFFDGEGKVIGSLGLLIPEFRWSKHQADTIIQALKGTAAALSRQLGHSPVHRVEHV